MIPAIRHAVIVIRMAYTAPVSARAKNCCVAASKAEFIAPMLMVSIVPFLLSIIV